jgi:hypothetical protein
VFSSVTYHHIKRELNTVADGLANMGLAARSSGTAWGLRPRSWEWAERGPRYGTPPLVPPCPQPRGPIPPVQTIPPSMLDVALGIAEATPADIRFNGPDSFTAGCLHDRLPQWDRILDDSASAERVRGWIRHKVNIHELWQNREDPERMFRGTHYPQATPPPMFLPNHDSCFGEFRSAVDSAVIKLRQTGCGTEGGSFVGYLPPSSSDSSTGRGGVKTSRVSGLHVREPVV